VKKVDGESRTRTYLIKDILDDVGDAESIKELEDLTSDFLQAATDVRYFGATLSFEASGDDASEEFRESLNEALPNHFQGPVQFLPSKSLNKVEENEEYDSLTSVISTGEENRQGGFDLDDKRIKYGIYPFWGLVDNNGAEDTQLTEADVQRLDTLTWRALKNQTTSRSKLGQEPRLYVRVEYEEGNYHIGGFQNMLELSDASADSLRSVDDVVVDATAVVDALERAADRIKTVHVVGDDRLRLEIDGESLRADELPAYLEAQGHDVHDIDVLEERDLAA
jgi:CRISPR-associated protein Csh2